MDEKKTKYTITAKEMESLEEIKKSVLQQANFLQKFKMLNTTQQARRTSTKFNPFSVQPQTTTAASARRSLIER